MAANPETPASTAATPTPTPTLKLVKELKREEIVFALARVPETERLIFGGSDFRVYDVDLAGEKPAPRALSDHGHGSYVTSVATALSGRIAVSGGYDGKLIWWDLERGGGEPIRSLDAHTRWVRDVAATADGTTLASVADDMVCRLWDAETGRLRHELRGHRAETPHHYPSMLFACAFSPDGRHLATGDKVGHVVVWDVADGRPVATLEAPIMYTWDPVQRRHSIGGIRSLAFSPDGTMMAVGGIGKIGNIDHLESPARVEVFDWRKGERTHEFTDLPKGLVERLIYHGPGPGEGQRVLAVGGANDGFLLDLDLKAKSVLVQEKAPGHVHDAVFGATPETLFIASHGKLAVYELKG
jgi:WD40 repeat protein